MLRVSCGRPSWPDETLALTNQSCHLECRSEPIAKTINSPFRQILKPCLVPVHCCLIDLFGLPAVDNQPPQLCQKASCCAAAGRVGCRRRATSCTAAGGLVPAPGGHRSDDVNRRRTSAPDRLHDRLVSAPFQLAEFAVQQGTARFRRAAQGGFHIGAMMGDGLRLHSLGPLEGFEFSAFRFACPQMSHIVGYAAASRPGWGRSLSSGI